MSELHSQQSMTDMDAFWMRGTETETPVGAMVQGPAGPLPQTPPAPSELPPLSGEALAHRAVSQALESSSPDTGRNPDIIAAEINAIKRQALGVALAAALSIGEKLIEVQNMIPRGRWIEWLRSNVDYSERKAQDLMRFYEAYGQNLPAAVAALDYTKALALLALPEGDREDMARRAAEEQLSSRQLNEEIKRLKDSYAEAQRTIFNLSQKNETAERIIKTSAENLKTAKSDAADARRRLREMEERPPEVVEVSRTPEAVERELEALREENERLKAEAAASAEPVGAMPSSPGRPAPAPSPGHPTPDPSPAAAVARFRDCYVRLTAEFKSAEALLAEIVKEDAKTGHMYATAMVKACKRMAERLGESGE